MDTFEIYCTYGIRSMLKKNKNMSKTLIIIFCNVFQQAIVGISAHCQRKQSNLKLLFCEWSLVWLCLKAAHILYFSVREASSDLFLGVSIKIQHARSLENVRKGVTNWLQSELCALGSAAYCGGCGMWPAFGRTFMCCFQETGLYEYKVFGVLATCTPELCADVYMDLAYRKDWDKYAKGKKINK